MILGLLVQRDPNILFRFIEFKTRDDFSFYEIEHENFGFIWELADPGLVMDTIIEYYDKKGTLPIMKRSIGTFFNTSDSQKGVLALSYIENIINTKNRDKRAVEIAFNVITQKCPRKKMTLLKISYN